LLLKKFWRAISRLIYIDPLSGRPDDIAKINPDKIYIENVRVALGVSTSKAKLYCDTAVRRRVFDRYIEVICPDDAVAASAPTEAELPELVHCWEDRGGGLEDRELVTSALRKREFYRLRK
jgi:hypothetical protein